MKIVLLMYCSIACILHPIHQLLYMCYMCTICIITTQPRSQGGAPVDSVSVIKVFYTPGQIISRCVVECKIYKMRLADYLTCMGCSV